MGLTINYTFDSSVTALETSNATLYNEYTTAVATAVQYFESQITNPITVNIQFGWGELNNITVKGAGESEAEYDSFSYDQLLAAMQTTDVTSPVQEAAVASLPLSDPTDGKGAFWVTDAEQLALGLTGGGVTGSTLDGYVGLDDKLNWTWVGQSYISGSYDAVAVLEHEISEDLGRTAEGGKDTFNDGKDDYTPLDLFRYTAVSGSPTAPAAPGTATGARDEPFAAGYSASAQSYFSYNGQTVTLPYDTPSQVASGYDIADWDPSVGADAFAGAVTSGQAASVSTTDLEELNVLGYDLPCYARATHIRTTRGDVAVERLRVGDVAITASGGRRPVVWIGRRALDLARHPDPACVLPVRVEAGAFGAGLPYRDLWLSPGHNVAFEGALIPVSRLVNGRSVAQIACERVEYWHVELDAHDVLLAEGLPAESYLDCGNRASFSNSGAFVEAHPDFSGKHWSETCLPLAHDGPAVVAVKRRLLGELEARGAVVTHEDDAHLIADGRRIDPTRDGRRLDFALPPDARDVTLRSRVFVPAHSVAESTDPRTLGLCVARLEIDGAALDLATLEGPGWHKPEGEGGVSHRWTDGRARIPGGARVSVELAGVGYYLAPVEDAARAAA